jgi:Spx/MgsR family transcriptional regulator
MKTILYGIHNCDNVKKAQKWLLQNNITYTFHDYRKDGIDKNLINVFLDNMTWQELLNKRSTSYRHLSEQQKTSLNKETIIALFLEFPTLIKRPLLVHNSNYQLGFKVENYKQLFSL